MVMSLPRTFRSSSGFAASRSRPSNRISPDGWLAAGIGQQAAAPTSAVTDLPEPDSPTSATVLAAPDVEGHAPRPLSVVSHAIWWKATVRSRTDRMRFGQSAASMSVWEKSLPL
jgi:hypothetical protein